jgi:hypothetical protein
MKLLKAPSLWSDGDEFEGITALASKEYLEE